MCSRSAKTASRCCATPVEPWTAEELRAESVKALVDSVATAAEWDGDQIVELLRLALAAKEGA